MRKKEIVCEKVYYELNEEAGLDPYCHECTSHKSRASYKGYVHCCRDGFQLLHKWVYWNATGETPEVVYHLCGNPICFNLTHLKGMTGAEAKQLELPATNTRPPSSWGRPAFANRTLEVEKVLHIKELLEQGLTPVQIQRKLGVSSLTIKAIMHKQTYQYVSGN